MAFHVLSEAKRTIPNFHGSAKQFLQAAIDGAKHLGWDVVYVDDDYVAADTPDGHLLGQCVSVEVVDKAAILRSESRAGKFYHAKLNRENIDKLQQEIDARLEHRTPPEVATESGMSAVDERHEQLKVQHPHKKRREILEEAKAQSKSSWFELIIPQKGYFVAPIIVNINVLIFLLMVISGGGILDMDNATLLRWGADFRPLTVEGESWRLLTSCFVHASIFHLACNMAVLMFVSVALEPLIGSLRYAVLYLLLGIASSMVSTAHNAMTISVGASGAIFGLFGIYLALLTTNLVDKYRGHTQLLNFGLFVVINLTSGSGEGVDSAAHFSGFFIGLVMGYALLFSLHRPHSWLINALTLGLLSWATIGLVHSDLRKLPNTKKMYDANLDKYEALETTAIHVYSLADSLPTQEFMLRFDHDGIQNWLAADTLLMRTDTLDLPDYAHDRIHLLERYTSLRLATARCYYKARSENSKVYEDSVRFYRTQVKTILDTIDGKVPQQ